MLVSLCGWGIDEAKVLTLREEMKEAERGEVEAVEQEEEEKEEEDDEEGKQEVMDEQTGKACSPAVACVVLAKEEAVETEGG